MAIRDTDTVGVDMEEATTDKFVFPYIDIVIILNFIISFVS